MSQILNGCDCCGFGFENFRDRPYWFVSTLNSNKIYRLDKETLLVVDSSSFTEADRIVEVDRRGHFYALRSPSTGSAYLEKYKYDGTLVWSYTVPGALITGIGTGNYQFAIDNELNIFIAFQVAGAYTPLTTDLRVIKLDSDANVVWTFTKPTTTRIVSGAGHLYSFYQPYGVGVSPFGKIHITGERSVAHFNSPSSPTGNSWTHGRLEVQLDPDGVELWSDISTNTDKGIEGGALVVTEESFGLQAVFDADDNVILRYCPARLESVYNGASDPDHTPDYITLRSYDSSGGEIFVYKDPVPATTGETEFPRANLIEYLNGFLYMASDVNPSPGFVGYYRRYSGADFLTEDWNYDIQGPGTGGFGSKYIRFAVDYDGTVYGSYRKTTSPQLFVLVKLDGDDGSEIEFSDLIDPAEIPYFPLMPPGRSSIIL